VPRPVLTKLDGRIETARALVLTTVTGRGRMTKWAQAIDLTLKLVLTGMGDRINEWKQLRAFVRVSLGRAGSK
jgi:hypothetical protein